MVSRIGSPLQGVLVQGPADEMFTSLEGLPMTNLLLTALNHWENRQLNAAIDTPGKPALSASQRARL